jgi:hypothetical protein
MSRVIECSSPDHLLKFRLFSFRISPVHLLKFHLFSLHLLIFHLFCLSAQAQRAQPPQRTPPHFGYIYPAGGQQGTTVAVTVGGQFLRDLSGVHVCGDGLQVTVGKYSKPLNAEEYFRLQDKLKSLRQRFQAEKANAPPGGSYGLYRKLQRELGVTEDDIKAVREFVAQATDPKRQRNFQIAETVTLEIKLAADAPPGPRELRLVTAAGLSNPLGFQVGKLPECRKSPSSGVTTETEVREPLPVVLNGQILPGGADRFTFHARKGARLVAVAAARDLIPYLADAVPGWFQAALTLYDSAGDEVAYADDYRFQPDPVLHYEVPADGRYVLEIKDAIYRGRQDFVYRVTLGELPFVTGIFPLGGHEGRQTAVAVKGWNLTGDQISVNASPWPGIHRLSLPADPPPFPSLWFASDIWPECREEEPNDTAETAQRLTPPVIVNGRIDRPGDWDVFRFEGRAGSPIVAEVFARRLGSPLDSVFKLTNAAGQLLIENDDYEDKAAALLTHHADSRLALTLPADGTYYLYLGDVQHKGGEEYAYRLRIGPPRPDFELRVVPSSVNARAGTAAPITVYALRRDGFDGDIALELKDPPPGFRLDAPLLPGSQDRLPLTLTVPAASAEKPFSLSLQGRAVIQGRKVLRRALPAEDMIQAFAYHQLVPAQQWLVTVMERRWANVWWRPQDDGSLRLPAGGTARARFTVPAGPLVDQVQLTLSDPPPGIEIKSVSPVRGGIAILLRADASKVKPGLRGNLIVNAAMEHAVESAKAAARGAKQHIPLGSLPAIPFQIVRP